MNKVCRVCVQSLPVHYFSKDRYAKDGLVAFCKWCRRDKYLENRAEVLAHSKKYNEVNSQQRRKRCLDYYYRNQSDRSQKMADWYRSNKDKVRDAARDYIARNPGYGARKQAARRAAVLRATPSWADHDKITAIYALSAWLTKLTGVSWEVDHIIPLRSKIVCGLHVETNLRVILAAENLAKGNRQWPGMPEAMTPSPHHNIAL